MSDTPRTDGIEMLEALEYIVSVFAEPAFGGEDVRDMHHMALRAIAKAKGERHE